MSVRPKQRKALFMAATVWFVVVAFAFTTYRPVFAVNEIPKILNYQARITDSSGVPVADGTLNIAIKIHDAQSGGSCLYAMRGTCGSPSPEQVTVTNGVFSMLIGDAGDNEIPETLFDNNVLFLGVTVASDTEMTPRKRIAAAPYALNADKLDDLDATASGSTTPYIVRTTTNGNLTITGDPQGASLSSGSVYVNPAAATANETLLGIGDNGTERWRIDKEGDVTQTGSLLATAASSTAQFIFRGAASHALNLFEVQDANANRMLAVSATATTIGSTSSTEAVIFNSRVGSNLTPVTDAAFDLGDYNRRWRDLWLSGGSANIAYDTSGTSVLQLGWSDVEGRRARLYSSSQAIQITPILARNGGININASGNVGIGTASPQGSLEVVGTIRLGSTLYFTNNTSYAGNRIAYVNTGFEIFGSGSQSAFISNSGGQSFLTSLLGIGNTAPANQLTVGSATSTFEVDASGNILKINNVAYSWPSTQGSASTVLTNNGSGVLTWSAAGGSTTLQQAYNNATSSTELSISGQNPLTIADTLSGTGNIFEIQDLTNPSTGAFSTRYLTVSATGSVFGNLNNGHDLTVADGLMAVCADGTCPAGVTATVDGELFVEGDIETDGDLRIDGGDLFTAAATFRFGAAATSIVMTGGTGSTGCTLTGTTGLMSCDQFLADPASAGLVLSDYVLDTQWTEGTMVRADFNANTTQTGSIIGSYFDFKNNLTTAGQAVTGYEVLMPVVTTSTFGNSYYGFRISEAGKLTQNATGTILAWAGLDVAFPDTQENTGSGILSATGVNIVGGPASAGNTGTRVGVSVDLGTGASGGFYTGINLNSRGGTASTDEAIVISDNWDTGIHFKAFSGGSSFIRLDDDTSLVFRDGLGGSNILMTLADAGTTGNLTLTGDLQIDGSTTLGDASADTLTTNFGTWNVNNQITTNFGTNKWIINSSQSVSNAVELVANSLSTGSRALSISSSAAFTTSEILSLFATGASSGNIIGITSSNASATSKALSIDFDNGNNDNRVITITTDESSTSTTAVDTEKLAIFASGSIIGDGNLVFGSSSTTNLVDFSGARIRSNLTPKVDNLYSLGDPALRWKDLWLSGGSANIALDQSGTSVLRLGFESTEGQRFVIKSPDGIPLQIRSGNAGNSGLYVASTGVTISNLTVTGTVANIEGTALTTGQALRITTGGTGLTTGSALFVTSPTTAAVSTNGIVSINATGNYTSTSNAGLLNVSANSTTAGTVMNLQANALTTGQGLRVGSTSTLTSGNLLNVTSSGAGAISSGIARIESTGNFTSSASDTGLLTLYSQTSTGGTLLGINGDNTTTGSLIHLAAHDLSTGSAITAHSFAGVGFGLTTGHLLDLDGYYEHDANEVGSMVRITPRDKSDITSTTIGLLIQPEFSSASASMTRTLTGMKVDPTFQASGANCNSTAAHLCVYNGIDLTTPSYSVTTANTSLIFNGLVLSSAGSLNPSASGAYQLWNGMKLAMPSASPSGGAVVSATAISITGPTTVGSTDAHYSILDVATSTFSVSTGIDRAINLNMALTSTSANTAALVGLDINPQINLFSAAASTKSLAGLRINNPTITQCRVSDNSDCRFFGAIIGDSGRSYTHTDADKLVYQGLAINAESNSFTQSGAAGTIEWRGITMRMPNITRTTGTVTAVGLEISGGSNNGGTMYSVVAGATSGAAGFGTLTPSATRLAVEDLNSTGDVVFAATGTALTSGKLFNLAGGTAMTTGSVIDVATATYVTAGGDTGNAFNLAVAHASTSGAGVASTVNGINVSSRFNLFSTGATSKFLRAINVAAPIIDNCRVSSSLYICAWTGLRMDTTPSGGYTHATDDDFDFYGLNIQAPGPLVQNTAAGTINWRGLNMNLPNITQTTGTVTSYGISITGGTVTSGTQYGIFLDNGANIRFNEGTSEIIFPDVASTTNGMIKMMNGSGNANGMRRCVLCHSETFSDWGLAYNDSDDQFYIQTSNSATPAVEFPVTSGGGTSVTLDVNGSIEANFALASTGALCHATNGAANNQTITDCNGTPADVAEWYPVTGSATSGDIVVATDDALTYQSDAIDPLTGSERGYKETHTISVLDRSARAYAARIIGIVSTSPAVTYGEGVISSASSVAPVAIAGRVPTKVSVENGPIRAGDPITSSSVAGVGMKATKPGTIVGYALDAWEGPGAGSVLVLVDVGFHSGSVIGNDGSLTTMSDDVRVGPRATATESASNVDSFSLRFASSVWMAASATPALRNITIANKASSPDDYRLSFANDLDQEIAWLSDDGDLSIAGTLSVGGGFDFAETFPSRPDLEPGDLVMVDPANENGYGVKKTENPYENSALGVISTKPGFLTGKSEEGSSPVALAGRVPAKVNLEGGVIMPGDPVTSSSVRGVGMKATQPGRVVGIALEKYEGTGTGRILIFVNPSWWNGPTPAAQASAGSALTIEENSILDFKRSVLSNVGAVIGADGLWGITSEGYLVAQRVEAKQVVAEQVSVKAASDAPERTVGVGRIQAGYDATFVLNPKATENSLIVVTFETNPGANWWIEEKRAGQFMVKMAQPAHIDQKFTYWIVGVEGVLDTALGSDDSASSTPEVPGTEAVPGTTLNPDVASTPLPTGSASGTEETSSGTPIETL